MEGTREGGREGREGRLPGGSEEKAGLNENGPGRKKGGKEGRGRREGDEEGRRKMEDEEGGNEGFTNRGWVGG